LTALGFGILLNELILQTKNLQSGYTLEALSVNGKRSTVNGQRSTDGE
jgi:hypothetical protein